MAALGDTITFLGTAGARFVVIRQFLASGGAWLNLGNTQILFDPGPGSTSGEIINKLILAYPSRLNNCTVINLK